MLTANRVKHHTCKRIQEFSKTSDSNYYNELYNEFCTHLQKDYNFYEQIKIDCITKSNRYVNELICFTYKFE